MSSAAALMVSHRAGARGGGRPAGAAAGWIGSRPIGDQRPRKEDTGSLVILLRSPRKKLAYQPAVLAPSLKYVFSVGIRIPDQLSSNTFSEFTSLPLILF